MCLCSQRMKKASEEGKIGRKLSDHKLNRRSDAEWLHLKPLTEGKKQSSVCTQVLSQERRQRSQIPSPVQVLNF